MKLFNKIHIIFSVFTASLLCAGCHDLLNEPAENRSFTGEADYTISANMVQPLIGVYGKFTETGWEDFPFISVRGDDVNAAGDQPGFAGIDNFTYDKDDWMANAVWQNWYNDILNTYSAVDQINKYRAAGADSILANQYIAEVKTIRGFMLLQIARVWGDVFIPLNNDPFALAAEELSTKEQVMQYISTQMDESIPLLPNVNPRDRADIPGGITKHAALAIKAMANLEMKNYQAVADATAPIINSGKFVLEPDYYELFKVKKGKLNRENLLEWQYTDLGQSTGGKTYTLGEFFGPLGWSPKTVGAEGGWGFFEPTLKYVKFMLDRGETTRLETTVIFTNRGIDSLKKVYPSLNIPQWISNTTRSGDVFNDFSRALFSSGKHYLPSDQLTPKRTTYGVNKNFILIRYPEVLLMYAEALARGASGSAGTAAQAVNQVRSRAGMTQLASVSTDQVMDEKFAELAMEWGIRYYDMVRLEKYNELNYEGRTFNADLVYFPYPQKQVDKIPALQGK